MGNTFLLISACVSLVCTQPIGDGNVGGVDLRILPFGDSITFGQASPDGNGYRLELYDKLSRTNNIEYLGSIEHGTMEKNRNEGHQGFDIEMIREEGMPDLSLRPNIILLMLGTNNIVFNFSREKAPELLSDLIQFFIQAYPDAAILVATITPLHDPLLEQHKVEYNGALPNIVRRFSDNGKHVALVDMGAVKLEHINDYDTVHPTDEGYKLIARAWYQAIVDAANKGWIDSPVDTQAATEQLHGLDQVSEAQQPEATTENGREILPIEPSAQVESIAPTKNAENEPSTSFDQMDGGSHEDLSKGSPFPRYQDFPRLLRQRSNSREAYLVLCSLALALVYVLRRPRRLSHWI